MYHSIGENAAHFTVTPDAFRSQLTWLADHDWSVVSLSECVRRARAGETGKFCALTFDDGYRDFLTEAAPVLKEHRYQATVFLIAGRMGESYRNSQGVEIPLLTWDETASLARDGFTVGSHTLTHQKLSKLAAPEARHELTASRDLINSRLNTSGGLWLCYPSGRHSAETMSLAREAGYVGAVTVVPGHPDSSTDPFAVPRAYVHREMDLNEFAALFA
jgi:peptidoglycan/xylan/chitin deacetylase (PgdA/CDA1 family)